MSNYGWGEAIGPIRLRKSSRMNISSRYVVSIRARLSARQKTSGMGRLFGFWDRRRTGGDTLRLMKLRCLQVFLNISSIP